MRSTNSSIKRSAHRFARLWGASFATFLQRSAVTAHTPIREPAKPCQSLCQCCEGPAVCTLGRLFAK